MIINVTEEHIKHGCRNSGCYCPVALAIRDVVKGSFRVGVGVTTLSIMNNDRTCLFKAPIDLDVATKIQTYDHTGKMEPFTFELDVSKNLLKG